MFAFLSCSPPLLPPCTFVAYYRIIVFRISLSILLNIIVEYNIPYSRIPYTGSYTVVIIQILKTLFGKHFHLGFIYTIIILESSNGECLLNVLTGIIKRASEFGHALNGIVMYYWQVLQQNYPMQHTYPSHWINR